MEEPLLKNAPGSPPSKQNSSNFLYKAILIAVMLFSGTINTTSKKQMNQTYASGLGLEPEKFKKPWFQTAIMFAGEMCCLILFWFQLSRADRASVIPHIPDTHQDDSKTTLLPKPTTNLFEKVKEIKILLVPTIFDLLGTSFGGIGLIYVDASVWQMLRGSVVIFSGIFSKIFLKRRLLPYRWTGIALVTFGLALVGTSSLLHASQCEHDEQHTYSFGQQILGICLILCGQVCSALQFVIEELYVRERNFKPALVVGCEGTFGEICMILVVLPLLYFIPGSDHGSVENFRDAFTQIGNSGALVALGMTYWVSIAFYNFSGLSVAILLTSVHRTLIDALRTVFVWLVSLFVYYQIDTAYGEPLNRYSIIQLLGFALLFLGTLVYNEVIRFPSFFRYEINDDNNK